MSTNRSDKLLIQQLTLQLCQHRLHPFYVNRAYGIILKHCPIVQCLIEKGELFLSKSNNKTMLRPPKYKGMSSYNGVRSTRLLPTKQLPPAKVCCPCCNNVITLLPDVSFSEHSKYCRLIVYGDYRSSIPITKYYERMQFRKQCRKQRNRILGKE